MPAADAQSPDDNERAIMDLARTGFAALNSWFCRRRALNEQRLADLGERMTLDQADDAVMALERDVASLQLRMEPVLKGARAKEQHEQRERRAFMDANDLQREARHPDSLYLHFSVLAVLLLVEGVVNAWAFGLGSYQGWVGGLQQALVVAAINLAVSFAAGLAVREIVHVRRWRKAIGVVVAVGYALFLGAYTLLIGHYRAALASDPEQAMTAAVAQLTASPFAIGDVPTILLMIASAGFALLAFATAITTRDIYPGYSAVVRHCEAAQRRLQFVRERYLAGLDALFLAQSRQLETRLRGARDAGRQVRQTVETARHLAAQYQRAAAEIIALCDALLRRYRATNERVRTAPAPTYFAADAPALGVTEILATDSEMVAKAEGWIADLPRSADAMAERAAAVRTEIARRYRECLEATPAYFAHTDALAMGGDSPPRPPAAEQAPKVSPVGEDRLPLAVVAH